MFFRIDLFLYRGFSAIFCLISPFSYSSHLFCSQRNELCQQWQGLGDGARPLLFHVTLSCLSLSVQIQAQLLMVVQDVHKIRWSYLIVPYVIRMFHQLNNNLWVTSSSFSQELVRSCSYLDGPESFTSFMKYKRKKHSLNNSAI